MTSRQDTLLEKKADEFIEKVNKILSEDDYASFCTAFAEFIVNFYENHKETSGSKK